MTNYSPIRVLLVDDHRTTLWGLAALIGGEAPRMAVAGLAMNGREALQQAIQVQPDVIVLDLELGGENGFDLMPELRRACTARIVILTGIGDPGLRNLAVGLGAGGFVRKDESAEVLLDAICGVN